MAVKIPTANTQSRLGARVAVTTTPKVTNTASKTPSTAKVSTAPKISFTGRKY